MHYDNVFLSLQALHITALFLIVNQLYSVFCRILILNKIMDDKSFIILTEKYAL